MPLRPDIALTVPDGPGRGLHLLDAKFRLQRVADLVGEGMAGTEGGWSGDPGGGEEAREERLEAEERRGSFKRADLYKMHTYRDAIRGARSVWALYPGDEARFFPAAIVDDGTVAQDGASDGRRLRVRGRMDGGRCLAAGTGTTAAAAGGAVGGVDAWVTWRWQRLRRRPPCRRSAPLLPCVPSPPSTEEIPAWPERSVPLPSSSSRSPSSGASRPSGAAC
ncbi:MAG: hypothetical protein IPJ58_09580 [Ardenticatenia bacterium]|nr:hypothetical protein [Ardenticatenia bacterium]